MTEEYKKKLVMLAKDIMELNSPTICNNAKEVRYEVRRKEMLFTSKLNYLLGYIMALEDN